MNAQPVYPARRPAFTAQCVDCKKHKQSPDLFADLDAKPGTYHCAACLFTFHLWSHDRISAAQIERDRREAQQ